MLRPSLVTPAGAGEDKPSLALAPCSLLQPLPHPAPSLGTQRAYRETQTDPQRTQLNVEGDPEGQHQSCGSPGGQGTGKPPTSKDSTPTGSTSSFPLGASAETRAILLPASCPGRWEASPLQPDTLPRVPRNHRSTCPGPGPCWGPRVTTASSAWLLGPHP